MIVTRFAPSPTGFLHLGHAYSALIAWQRAKAQAGRFLLRLEDIDEARCRPAFAEAIFADLAWLGLDWETPVRRQSQAMADYADALSRLDALGVLYRCVCTRGEILAEIARAGGAPHPGETVAYPGLCRRRGVRADDPRPFAIRLDIAAALARSGPSLDWYDERAGIVLAAPAALGDIVIARKGMPTSYHLAVTVDDALQGVTLVTRGVDLFTATHVHRLLQALLGLPTPAYLHHDLVLDPATGRRFAKRDRSATLASLRAEGFSPETVRRRLGFG